LISSSSLLLQPAADLGLYLSVSLHLIFIPFIYDDKEVHKEALKILIAMYM
jgi:hypothetical protein